MINYSVFPSPPPCACVRIQLSPVAKIRYHISYYYKKKKREKKKVIMQ